MATLDRVLLRLVFGVQERGLLAGNRSCGFSATFAHLSLRHIMAVVACDVGIGMVRLLVAQVLPPFRRTVPLELLGPLHLQALPLFVGLHFLNLLLELLPLQDLIGYEIPPDFAFFLETHDVFLQDVVLLKRRILFEQLVDPFRTRCAVLLELVVLFHEAVLVLERPPEVGLEQLRGVLFLLLENVAFEVEHVAGELVKLLHERLVGAQVEVVVLPQDFDRLFPHQRESTFLQFLVQARGARIDVITILLNLFDDIPLRVLRQVLSAVRSLGSALLVR